ncbi:MAG TPA: hypothetical protein VL914_01140 [Vicinamibacterales bacterium]|nr:hypothetical protein [Vicinamibacterales bacterium]
MRKAAAACALAIIVFWFAPRGSAHAGITSKFTYNAEVYPVFLNRCGRCHIDGGVGPMSLLKYEDAYPWAESLRAELMTAYADASAEARGTKVDPHDFIKAAHRQISARELDIVLNWATGGTPQGDKATTPVPPPFKNDWAAGPPSLAVAMAEPYRIPAGTFEATQEFVLPVPATMPLSVTRIDLLPGTPTIVRSAAISLRSPDGSSRVLGTWVPRQAAAAITVKPAVQIEPGSRLIARIHYKKTWKLEGEAISDRSTIGLYTGD